MSIYMNRGQKSVCLTDSPPTPYYLSMSKQLVITLPDEIYEQAQRLAYEHAQAIEGMISDLVQQSLAPFPIHPHRSAMLQETAAFERLHPHLKQQYLGQHVAITDGKVVDHDMDSVALLQRIRATYPNQVVLLRQVEETAEIELHFRSPRFDYEPVIA